MSIDAAFLADILEHPQDDSPRLIYADWLEDNHDADQAEFIRLQIERSHLAPNDPRVVSNREREQVLLRHHETRWTSRLLRRGVIFARFTRGFVENIVIHADRFLDHGEELFRLAPILDVTLDNAVPVLNRMTRHTSLFARLRALRMPKPLDDVPLPRVPLAALLCSPDLANLRTLDLQGGYLCRSGLGGLARSDAIPGVRELGLALNEMHDAELELLLDTFAQREIAVLDLRANRLTDQAVPRLIHWSGAVHLRWLCLEGNQISEAGAEAILSATSLSRLERLGLATEGLPQELNQRLQRRFGSVRCTAV